VAGRGPATPLRPGKVTRDSNIEENLISTTYHAAFVIQIVNLLLRECNLHGPVLRGDGCWITLLRAAHLRAVQVDGFPEWIVVGVQRSTVVVEFVGEDQLEFRPCRSPIWSFLVV